MTKVSLGTFNFIKKKNQIPVQQLVHVASERKHEREQKGFAQLQHKDVLPQEGETVASQSLILSSVAVSRAAPAAFLPASISLCCLERRLAAHWKYDESSAAIHHPHPPPHHYFL